MKQNIEIIEDNAGGLTIQNTETKAVAHFDHKTQAIDSLKAILSGDEMSGWDLSDPEYYITDEEFYKHAPNGGLKSWTEEDAKDFVGA